MRHESSFRWLACFAGSLPAYEYSPWQTSRPLPLFRLTAGVKINSIAPSIPDKLFMLQGYDSPIRRTSGNQRHDDMSHLDVARAASYELLAAGSWLLALALGSWPED